MIMVPSIDVERGIAVKRVGGVKGTGFKLGDPLKIGIKLWEMGARIIHIIDLDGAERGEPVNLWLVKQLKSEVGDDLVIQFGGGIRTVESALKVYWNGADILVVGTAWTENPSILEEISDIGIYALAAVDVKAERVAVRGWKEVTKLDLDEAFRLLEPFKIYGYLVTCIDVEGRSTGACLPLAAQARSLTRKIIEYAGGVKDEADLKTLASIGVDATIVGMSFYLGELGNKPIFWYGDTSLKVKRL
ncbi:MAG TPA: hypothetical protein EYH17_03560 [Pyrodictium sp.]|nr:hypothetical protein [Pyrodictium sp.]